MGKEVFGRGQYNETAPALIAGAGMGFPLVGRAATTSTPRATWLTLTHIFTASTVLEVIGGTNWATQDVYPWDKPIGMPSTIATTCRGTGRTFPRTIRTTSCRT